MKKLAVLFFLIGYVGSSQNLYWDKPSSSDSIAIAKSIENLSHKIILVYREKDLTERLENLFRLRMATKEYELSNQLIDSLRGIYLKEYPKTAKTFDIKYSLINEAKLIMRNKRIGFSQAFEDAFRNATATFTRTELNRLEFVFDIDQNKFKNRFYKKLKEQNVKDSISIKNAFNLIKSYISYSANSEIGDLGKSLVSEIDNQFYIIKDSVTIPTKKDGTISALIVRGKNAVSKSPTILRFSIYPHKYSTTIAKGIVEAGYIGVIAHTRGKRYSPNEVDPFEFDASDVYEVIDWISKQPWSNGEVGMYGGSYLGFTQWAAAKKVHPALKTIIPQVAVGAGIDYPQHNGVFMSFMLKWIRYVTNNKTTDNEDFRNEKKWDSLYGKWYQSGKSFRALDSLEGKPNKNFQRWLDHPSFDSYWQNMAASGKDFAKINIPVLTMTGYYDDDQIGALYYFKEHHKFHKNPNHHLLIGPYDHGGAQGYPREKLNGYTLDSVANIDIKGLAFEWFDYVLKDSVKPAPLKNKVNIQTMGMNKWRHAASIQEISNDTLKFYLDNTIKNGFYQLSPTIKNREEFIHYELDFADRSDTTKPFSMDNFKILDSTINIRKQMAFATEPFEESFEINGQFIGKINLELNKKDIDINILLYEIQPDGTYFNLSNYLGRASYAKNREKRNLLVPFVKQQIPIKNSFFTSKKISKGSKLLVLLSINNNPEWQVNHGTGKDVSDETIKDAKEPLRIKWYTDSYLEFPIFKE